uniref:EF-hand domain-containing protein n=1 Tax=Meloidogyne incognita TaxID=6306 RepID=A0A914N3P5_MELIC
MSKLSLISIFSQCLLLVLSQEQISDFDVIDKNADGLVSYGEFQSWHRIALGAEPKQSAVFFGTHDLDKDGKLSVAEFVPLAFELSRKPVKEAEKVFQKFDSNSDGFLSVDELKKEKISDGIIDGLFDVADVDGNGNISEKEFSNVADSFESHLSRVVERAGQAQSLMAALDLDGDGKINSKELIAHQRKFGVKKENIDSNETVELAIKQLDIDRDGYISFFFFFPNSTHKPNLTLNDIPCIFLNARSIVNKISDLSFLVEKTSPKIIFINETWISAEKNIETELSINNRYDVILANRKTRGGGCAILISRDIPFKTILSCSKYQCELININLFLPKKINIFLIYRPPNCSLENTKKILKFLYENIENNFILCGDMNIPNINWVDYSFNCQKGKLLLDFMFQTNSTQHVTEFTRLSSTLDLIFSSPSNLLSNVKITE